MSIQKETNIDGISVIIPYYNDTNTISAVIDAVKVACIDFKYEIIVVNDGSTDVIPEFLINDNKIRLIHKDNEGVASARNYGVRMSAFEIVSFVDSDDIWHESKIQKQLYIFDKYKLSFLGSNSSRVFLPLLTRLFKINYKLLPIKWMPHISTVVMKKNYFYKIGGFDEKMKYAEDGDFFMRIAKDKNLYILPECLAIIAPHKNSNYKSGLSSRLDMMYNGEKTIINNHFCGWSKVLYKILIFIKYSLRKISVKNAT